MKSKEHDDISVPFLHQIAELYGQWTFNFMVKAAEAIAHDFVERPRHYRQLSDDLTGALSCFRSLVGSHPDWPDAEQRTSNFRVLSDVTLAGAPLREAALIYVERGSEHNQDLLLDAFLDTVLSFQNQTKSLEGRSLGISCSQISAIFDNAVKLFQSDEIVRVFDLPPAPKDNWPIGGNFDGDGAYLVAEVIRILEAINFERVSVRGTNRPINISMSQTKFYLLQRAAYYGGLVISEILAGTQDGDDIRRLVGNTYKWTKALQRLIPDVVRVWKDQNYRLRLTDIEWGMVDPHPVEAIAFAGRRRVPSDSFGCDSDKQTCTINGEICCCGGEQICSSNCEISPNPSCINCGSIGCFIDGGGGSFIA